MSNKRTPDKENQLRCDNTSIIAQSIRWLLQHLAPSERLLAETLHYQITENSVPLPRLTPPLHGYRILHLSDLHIDAIADNADTLINRLNSLSFDMCVLTGDYKFGHRTPAHPASRLMAKLYPALRCRDGVYAVSGNHDNHDMMQSLAKLGVRVLDNSAHTLTINGADLQIAGISDPHHHRRDDIQQATHDLSEEIPTILLAHSPERVRQAASHHVDLYLCGHTHGGQLCLPNGTPILNNSRSRRRYIRGAWHYQQPVPMQGYTHCGVGTAGVTARWNCRPEIALHTLKMSDEQTQ